MKQDKKHKALIDESYEIDTILKSAKKNKLSPYSIQKYKKRLSEILDILTGEVPEIEKDKPDRETALEWWEQLRPLERTAFREKYFIDTPTIAWNSEHIEEIWMKEKANPPTDNTGEEQELFTSGEWNFNQGGRIDNKYTSYITFDIKNKSKLISIETDSLRESEANAHLITASKNLYYALKYIVDYEVRCREKGNPAISEKWFTAAKKALHQANPHYKIK